MLSKLSGLHPAPDTQVFIDKIKRQRLSQNYLPSFAEAAQAVGEGVAVDMRAPSRSQPPQQGVAEVESAAEAAVGSNSVTVLQIKKNKHTNKNLFFFLL